MQEQYTPSSTDRMGSESARDALIVAYGNVCLRCGKRPVEGGRVLAVDHIIPVARGGRNRLDNYQLLCKPCNSWKGTQVLDYRPGAPRGYLPDDLPIIPRDDRERKSYVKGAPEIADPVPPLLEQTPHDCFRVLTSLLGKYTTSVEQLTAMSERAGHLAARAELTDPERRRLEDRARDAEGRTRGLESSLDHEKKMRGYAEGRENGDRTELVFMRIAAIVSTLLALHFYFR